MVESTSTPANALKRSDTKPISEPQDKSVVMAVRSEDRQWQLLDAIGNPDLRHSPEATSVTTCVEQYQGKPEADDYGRLLASFPDAELALQCALALRNLVRQSPDGSESGLCFGIAADSDAESDKINEGAIAAVSLAGSAKSGEIIFSRSACEALTTTSPDRFAPRGEVRFHDRSGSVDALRWQTAETKPTALPKAELRTHEISTPHVLPMFLTGLGTLAAAVLVVVGGLNMLNEPSHAQIALLTEQQDKARVVSKPTAATEVAVSESAESKAQKGNNASNVLARSTIDVHSTMLSDLSLDAESDRTQSATARPVVATASTARSSVSLARASTSLARSSASRARLSASADTAPSLGAVAGGAGGRGAFEIELKKRDLYKGRIDAPPRRSIGPLRNSSIATTTETLPPATSQPLATDKPTDQSPSVAESTVEPVPPVTPKPSAADKSNTGQGSVAEKAPEAVAKLEDPAQLRYLWSNCNGDDLQRALTACRLIIESKSVVGPKLAELKLKYGRALRDSKDFDAAIVAYSDAIAIEPTAEAYNQRGVAHYDKREWEKAIADYTESLRLAPNFGEALNNRAWTYYKGGKAQYAIDDANKAVRLLANKSYAWDTRAHINEILGNRTAALSDYRKALKLDPANADLKAKVDRLSLQP